MIGIALYLIIGIFDGIIFRIVVGDNASEDTNYGIFLFISIFLWPIMVISFGIVLVMKFVEFVAIWLIDKY